MSSTTGGNKRQRQLQEYLAVKRNEEAETRSGNPWKDCFSLLIASGLAAAGIACLILLLRLLLVR